jgi:hypothetical protein
MNNSRPNNMTIKVKVPKVNKAIRNARRGILK